MSPTLILSLLNVFGTIRKNTQPTTEKPVEQKDYTGYYVIGILSFLFLLFIIFLIFKNKN